MYEPLEFGSRVRGRRMELGWTVRAAADRLEISSSRLAALERGRSYSTGSPTRPSRELVSKFAGVYGLPVNVLLASAGYSDDLLAELSEEARLLLVMFELLPAEQRKVALELIHVLANRYGSSPPSP